MKLEWNNCILCLNDLSGQVTDKEGDGGRSGKRNRKVEGNTRNDLENSSKTTELLINYLLSNKTDKHSGVIRDTKQLLESKEDGGSGVNFCEKCEFQLRRVSELHRELEVVQMKLVSVLKAVKATVLQSSGENGEGANVVLGIFEQCLREQESSFAGEGESEEEKYRLKEQRRILETVEAFQKAVIENDECSIDIPLVFLERCSAFRTRPSEQLLPFPDVTVKTEVPDLEDNLDTPMSDLHEQLSYLSPETEAPKTKYKKKTASTDIEIKREVLRPPRASTSTARLKMIEISNSFKRKKKEPPPKSDVIRPPPRKRFKVPPIFQLKPHSKLKRRRVQQKPHHLYCCSLCPFTTFGLYSMEEHLQNHETEVASQENPPPHPFQCDICPNLKFHLEQTSEFHKLFHNGHYIILCEPCNTWQAPLTFQDHMASHLEKTFPCRNCSYSCTTREKYIRHLFEHHLTTSILECDICGVQSSGKLKFLEHYFEVHQAIKKLVCDIDGCSKEFFNPVHLAAHKVTHTDKFKCSHCDKSFQNSLVLSRHLAAVAGEKVWLCDLCQESFPSKYSVNRHKIEKHGASKPKCDICGKEFIEQTEVTAHRRLHTGNAFACEHPGCDKVFETGNRLKVHMILHSTERNFICDLCGAALKSKAHFKRHKLTHAGDEAKKYECPECGKRFLFNKYLVGHLRVHTGDRPYICEACGKGFNQASTLARHKQKCFLGPAPPVIQKRDERAKPIKIKLPPGVDSS